MVSICEQVYYKWKKFQSFSAFPQLLGKIPPLTQMFSVRDFPHPRFDLWIFKTNSLNNFPIQKFQRAEYHWSFERSHIKKPLKLWTEWCWFAEKAQTSHWKARWAFWPAVFTSGSNNRVRSKASRRITDLKISKQMV